MWIGICCVPHIAAMAVRGETYAAFAKAKKEAEMKKKTKPKGGKKGC